MEITQGRWKSGKIKEQTQLIKQGIAEYTKKQSTRE